MTQEQVIAEIKESTPMPYFDYVVERNGSTTERIAQVLDLPYSGTRFGQDIVYGDYPVLYGYLDMQQAKNLGITDESQLFGAALNDPRHSMKSILKPTLPNPQNIPDDLSYRLGDELLRRNIILPGYVVHDQSDAFTACKLLINEFGAARVKDPSVGDIQNQATVYSQQDLESYLRAQGAHNFNNFSSHGLVLEAAITQDMRTLSIGQDQIGTHIFSYVGDQFETENTDGRIVYGGSKLEFYRGSLDSLDKNNFPTIYQTGIGQAHSALQVFKQLDPIVSRFGADIIHGKTQNGDELMGVLEHTVRFGGTTPALAFAANILAQKPELKSVQIVTHLDYYPTDPKPEGDHFFVSLDKPTLRITCEYIPS